MLLYQLYDIINKEIFENDFICYSIKLNAENEIYKVHFPNYPITPGVCMIKISQELMENHFSRKIRFSKIVNIKFLIPIIPHQVDDIQICIKQKENNNTGFLFDIQWKNRDFVFMKMNTVGNFSI